ncbi:sulfotransferase domain-containing protein [Muricauda sp. NFXS6]|uniref:sulfotransferase domain-containing protein n=1 Tax=Allomuricauda sp. NFXS6 TaxID=2819094 RepID=UPI0032DF43FD
MKYCIIIGTKKGGTSSLYEYLRQHPSIVGGFKKEPNFFGNIKNWEKGIEWYDEQFVGYNEKVHKYKIDATTDYTQDGFWNVTGNMKESGLGFKFIYILRDPFQKIESQTHQFLADRDTIRPIYECLDTRIIESTKYHKQLMKYLEFFPKDQFLLVDFSRMKNDIEEVMREVTEFLELERFQYDTSYLHNEKKSAIGQSFRIYRFIREILRKFRITPLIPQVAKDKLRLLFGKYGGKRIQKEDYQLTLEQKKYLKEELLPDVVALEKKFGFNTSDWEIHSV